MVTMLLAYDDGDIRDLVTCRLRQVGYGVRAFGDTTASSWRCDGRWAAIRRSGQGWVVMTRREFPGGGQQT